MNKGKRKCEILKTIRCQVAKKNGIEYTYTECTYQGECRGTCPKCEEELRYLTGELEKLKRSGKQVAVAGVAAAVIAAGAAGCAPDLPMDSDLPFTEVYETKGAMAPPEEYVTAGEPLPVLPSIGDVIDSLQQSQEIYMGSFERTTIQVEWETWLTKSGEDYDVFTVDGEQIIVTYHEDGWGDTVNLYAETIEDGENG